jgi:hypothetical protein
MVTQKHSISLDSRRVAVPDSASRNLTPAAVKAELGQVAPPFDDRVLSDTFGPQCLPPPFPTPNTLAFPSPLPDPSRLRLPSPRARRSLDAARCHTTPSDPPAFMRPATLVSHSYSSLHYVDRLFFSASHPSTPAPYHCDHPSVGYSIAGPTPAHSHLPLVPPEL